MTCWLCNLTLVTLSLMATLYLLALEVTFPTIVGTAEYTKSLIGDSETHAVGTSFSFRIPVNDIRR